MTPEQAITEYQARVFAEFINRNEYHRRVVSNMTPQEFAADELSVRNETNKQEYQPTEMEKWFTAKLLDDMYDAGKLLGFKASEQRLNAQEAHAIQHAPMKQVNEYLTVNYRDPEQFRLRKENAQTSSDEEP